MRSVGASGCHPGAGIQLCGCDEGAVPRPSQRTASWQVLPAGRVSHAKQSAIKHVGRHERRRSWKESRWPRPPPMVRTEHTTPMALTTPVVLTGVRTVTATARDARPGPARFATAAMPGVRPGTVP
ncbi:hypothetical protein Stsp01_11240 [Streptomyces sp. NBRC 13847]|nr:hypothetical protein Stsp01_11240 [Streptomyces sp. NBRC 13847]